MPNAELTLDRLSRSIMAARKNFRPDTYADPNGYVKLWKEDDVTEEGAAKAMTLILRTRGCTWDYQHSCTMCGYFVDVLPKKLTPQNLLTQWARAKEQHKGETILKVYTGGNFLDDAEVFPSARVEMVRDAAKLVKLIVVETRPEYIRESTVRPMVEAAREGGARVMFALGLESSDDRVCDEAINKGYGFQAFVEGAKRAREYGALVKAYLLLKPPFLTEEETVEDMVQSIRDAAPYSDVLSVNPTNVQKFTLVDRLYQRREYRPPWLWSILEVLRRGKPFAGTKILKSDPVGGGKSRGAHNCGVCDESIIGLLDRYNATQDAAFVEAAEKTKCACRARYDAARAMEGLLGASHLTD